MNLSPSSSPPPEAPSSLPPQSEPVAEVRSSPMPLWSSWIWDLLLVVILVLAAAFRFTGVNWDEHTHLHPDERFLTMVSSALEPVKSIPDYFNTETSTLNPHNRGYGFYVYGTLPVFIVRYAAEWMEEAGYDEIHLVGRQMSAIADLLTVLLVYLIANRLYRDGRNRGPLSLLAAGFAAFQALPIQQAHFYTVDTFANFFGFLAFYFAARLLPTYPLKSELRVHEEFAYPVGRNRPAPSPEVDPDGQSLLPPSASVGTAPETLFDRLISLSYRNWETLPPYVLFGAALGMAVASKINAAPLAILLPAAVLVRWLSLGKEDRQRWAIVYLRNMLVAAIVSLIVFRICQPYAFSGPGFTDFSLNPKWVQNIRDQRAQASGDVDFPPALQWARRPMVWFPFQNMVVWGLGLPLGILAWAGFLWMAWRMLRGEWRAHLLVWGWTALYFAWQASSWNPTMRYFLLIYPTLAIIAAWAAAELAEKGRLFVRLGRFRWKAGWAVGALALGLTFLWGYAFFQIYTRPLTRVAASRWIYQNMPGPINLQLETAQGPLQHPLAFRSGFTLIPEQGLVMAFRPESAGELLDVRFGHVVSTSGAPKIMTAVLSESPSLNPPLASGWIRENFRQESGGDPRGKDFRITFSPVPQLEPDRTYYLFITVDGMEALRLSGPLSLGVFTLDGVVTQILPEPVEALQAGSTFETVFRPMRSGKVQSIGVEHIVDWEWNGQPKTLNLALFDPSKPYQALASAEIREAFGVNRDMRGERYTFALDQAVELLDGKSYILRLTFVDGPGRLALYGSKQVNETSWDDALPWSLDGFNPYDYSAGVFRSDLNFEMYWDDDANKLDRFLSNLAQADYIFISSNRQWGTTTRVPERYPLTSTYYRHLIGCPEDKEITWCYSVAEPGTFQGDLGYTLIRVFASEPNLGGLVFNSQFAEEAFSVYDHPKVLIFQKTDAYDPGYVRELLTSVDLTKVIHLTPRKAGPFPGNLLLPTARLEEQRTGGTWSALFDREAIYNRYPGLAVVIWYLTLSLLGWVVYPFVRLALRGLPDRGYPLARLVGMLLLAYPVWLLGSYRAPFEPLTISAVFVGLVIFNGALFLANRESMMAELRGRWKYYLLVEGLTLAFFVLFLMVRFANPDLWHASKGGEKPMDFSYFNAVLKSTSFPPYDPWFAGGYINYYYFGFVLVGVPVKWLGIVPSVAYNLILPSLYAALCVSGFSVAWNLGRPLSPGPSPAGGRREEEGRGGGAIGAGVFAAVALGIVGNLGTVRMIWHGVQRLAPMEMKFEEAPLLTHLLWTVQGLGKMLTGSRLSFYPGDWYWVPSRAFPGEPITEFPAFTFLYADLHAHLIALPLTVLARAWALSILLGKWRWEGRGHVAASLVLGGLAIGVLKPTNTWDWPTYLAMGCAAWVYAALRYSGPDLLKILHLPLWLRRLIMSAAGVAALVMLSSLLFLPFNQWYGQGYNAVERWTENHTPFWSYITHWGLFLFLITSWLLVETIDWMATTPLSSLRKLMRFQSVGFAAAILVVGVIVYLQMQGVSVAWLVVLLGVWAAVLLLRPGMPDARRAVLFLFGTALALTLFVEVFRLQGDIGRMNTVFKFYLQAWTLMSISAGVAVVWLLPASLWESSAVESGQRWLPGWNLGWQIAAAVLAMGALLFPVTAGMDKMTDRISRQAPASLDGMAYMDYASYHQEEDMDLSQDARVIRWMQDNIQGSPVIVEANTPEYRWGSRFTIYTGLPGVVGWNWHQRQQRALTPDTWVFDRVKQVGEFYNTYNLLMAQDFLKKYDVHYIVVGQLERAIYTPSGLQKFEDYNGDLWREVYRNADTVIYEVLPAALAVTRER